MARLKMQAWTLGSESWSGQAGTWRVRARYGHPEGTRTAQGTGKTKGAARAALTANVERARQRYEARGQARGVDGSQTLSTYAAGWFERGKGSGWGDSTARLYEHVLQVLAGLPIAKVRMVDVTTGDVKDALRAVAKTRGKGLATSARSVLSGIFRDATERGACPRNVVRDVNMRDVNKVAKVTERQRPTDGDRSLSARELSRLLQDLRNPETAVGRAARGQRATVNSDMADLITVWVALALRASEVLSLRWVDVDLDAGTVHIRGTKTKGSEATLPLPRWAAEALRARQTAALATGTLGEYVFPGRDGGKREHSAVNRRLNAVLDAAGLTWARGHTLRKTAVTLAYETDGPLTAQRLARHGDIRTTESYYVKASGDVLTVSALDALQV